jgi:DNA-binding GntR family transcriptional regulator
MKTHPLTPEQVAHVRTVIEREIHTMLHEVADAIERDSAPEWLWLNRAFARALRPDPVTPPRRDT